MTDTEGDLAEWSFPAVPGAVRTARHAVHDALRDWGLDSAVGDEAVLLVSELVTNSMRYTPAPSACGCCAPTPTATTPPPAPDCWWRSPIRFRMRPPNARRDPTTRAAEDSSSWPARPAAGGTRRGKSGKTVWFELALPG